MRQQAVADGFRSGFEAKIGARLAASGVEYTYETARLPYVIEREYIPDFTITLPGGFPRHIEVKGYFPLEDRQKIVAVLKANPGLDLRLILQTPNRAISSGSKTTYAKWCDKHGIPWAADLPEGWLA